MIEFLKEAAHVKPSKNRWTGLIWNLMRLSISE